MTAEPIDAGLLASAEPVVEIFSTSSARTLATSPRLN